MSQTIELNGKRYDARTGKMLPAHEKVSTPAGSYVKPVKQSGVALDGFTRRKVPADRTKTSAYAVHKKTEKSKTLMRTAVKKPAPKPAAPAVARHRQAPHQEADPKRVSRAQSIKKSSLVSRFGTPQKAIKPITSLLPVRPEPAAPPVLGEHHKPSVAARHDAHHETLQRALEKADSHTQSKAKKPTRRQRLSHRLNVSNRTVNLASASLAAVLLIGFIAYQNVPNLSMKVATARAGVSGTLPGYQPAGFGMAGPIEYREGEITIRYKSNSDDRNFQVNQKTSQWNSETLLENYVATEQRNYQTFQDSGKTIYIYDQQNATWVDGGVWYQIEGNSVLSNDQLLRMAASM